MTLPVSLPYGLRDVKLRPITNVGTGTMGPAVDLANAQTLSFTEAEEFTELRGDDKLVTVHGAGPGVEWSLEAGGLSFNAVAVMYGGTFTTSGVTPNMVIKIRKKVTDVRPEFQIEGQVISDSGGDVHAVIFRCKCNDKLEGEFKGGEFFITSAAGVGLPSLVAANLDVLYDLIQNETAVAIT